jgi:hypothetical protein
MTDFIRELLLAVWEGWRVEISCYLFSILENLKKPSQPSRASHA